MIVVGALAAGGYFAIKSLKPSSAYISESGPKIGDLHKLETEPQSTVVERPAPVVPTIPTDVKPTETEPTSLKAGIQAMIDKKVTLKSGSKGANVGYIQQFMNAYFKKNLKVDNDYGPTLEANVKAYQKAVGVTQTGQIGPATLAKMVDWLNKNPQ